jgi:hypothetical protein
LYTYVFRFKYMSNVSIREYFSVLNVFIVCICNTAVFKIIPLLCTHVYSYMFSTVHPPSVKLKKHRNSKGRTVWGHDLWHNAPPQKPALFPDSYCTSLWQSSGKILFMWDENEFGYGWMLMHENDNLAFWWISFSGMTFESTCPLSICVRDP